MPYLGRDLPNCCQFAPLVFAAVLAGASPPVKAQENPETGDDDYVEALRECQSKTNDSERLVCFDAAVANIVTATEVGDVQVIDREEVRETRRGLFGFKLPDIGLFGDDDEEEDELFSTTITSYRQTGRRQYRFTTAEGAVWEMKSVPSRFRGIDVGDTVVFKEASLGYYFVRIDGQMGVKGRRIQ